MQQIFNFLLKNSNKLLFLLLLGISLVLTIQSHSYHRSKVVTSANYVSGGVYEKVNDVKEYLSLKSQNEQLAQENALLRKLLYNSTDSTEIVVKDSLKGFEKINVIQSKIIKNSYNVKENYLTLNSGAKAGIKPDMGVVNSLGIVGIVEHTSKNYATVISVLNTKIKINAKFKKSNHFGTLTWNGKSTGFLQLVDVPRLAQVRKGDTIVTGNESVTFPPGIGIGTIDKVYTDKVTNYYTLDIKLFNDMTNLGHVYILENYEKKEIEQLEAQTVTEDE
ncbi:rod shape-determining protein MreC [Flavobacterium sp. NST-5]|uniref:Cell shape-determining protein MreC n=1 Tax=Flavobacterium ichthyis TaxID=2698827 RepID=A0ABW9Z6S5_9FLAO|nr:rod shape-determining protein MreC [Flavobacterium ichthyis]NBL64566.1 rod shape-determining protein MreC [Flavobacterium ichthyis]